MGSGAKVTAAVFLLALLTAAFAGMRAYAIANPPPAPAWVQAGDFVEYNQTYTYRSLTASVLVNETVLYVNSGGAADMRIQRYEPIVPKGFPDSSLLGPAPYDSQNQSNLVTAIGTTNGTTSTSVESIEPFVTDLTMFITPSLITETNATLVSMSIPALGGSPVQAWKVNADTLGNFVDGQPFVSSYSNPSFIWFEKNSLVKVRESGNDTYSNGYPVNGIETIAKTNMPQLESSPGGGVKKVLAVSPSGNSPLETVSAFALIIGMMALGVSHYMRKKASGTEPATPGKAE